MTDHHLSSADRARQDFAAAEPAAAPRPWTAEETAAFVKARRGRNVAIFWALAAFVILVFVVTLTKLGPDVLDRPL